MFFIRFLFSFWAVIPWLVIAMMAALALRKQRDSKVMWMQAIGSAGMFLISMTQFVTEWIVFDVFGASKNSDFHNFFTGAFNIVIFLSLTLFAVGYCLERFKRRGTTVGGDPVQVTARAVD